MSNHEGILSLFENSIHPISKGRFFERIGSTGAKKNAFENFAQIKVKIQ